MVKIGSEANRVCLIADDDEFFRMALRSILQARLGFAQVIETGSLDEAIERLSDLGGADLALFDLAMPGMESAASLRAVRECFPELTIAVVSASSRRSDILQALETGVHGYVPKSLGAKDLAEALEAIDSGTIYVPASLADVSGEGAPLSALSAQREPDEPSLAWEGLTPRQRNVLGLLVQGYSNKEIARALNLGEGTVKVHVAALFRVLRVTSRSAAAAAGARMPRPLPSGAGGAGGAGAQRLAS
jgi:DNA-binding NarL/FixJ family response regulator